MSNPLFKKLGKQDNKCSKLQPFTISHKSTTHLPPYEPYNHPLLKPLLLLRLKSQEDPIDTLNSCSLWCWSFKDSTYLNQFKALLQLLQYILVLLQKISSPRD